MGVVFDYGTLSDLFLLAVSVGKRHHPNADSLSPFSRSPSLSFFPSFRRAIHRAMNTLIHERCYVYMYSMRCEREETNTVIAFSLSLFSFHLNSFLFFSLFSLSFVHSNPSFAPFCPCFVCLSHTHAMPMASSFVYPSYL